MQIPVLIEQVAADCFRARGGELFALTAEGTTREDALQQLPQQIQQQLAAGSELVPLEIPAADHPWLPFAGMYSEDDPLVQEWLQIMAEHRREEDEDEDEPEMP